MEERTKKELLDIIGKQNKYIAEGNSNTSDIYSAIQRQNDILEKISVSLNVSNNIKENAAKLLAGALRNIESELRRK